MGEWTVLAAFVALHDMDGVMTASVLALGTGTKCLPHTELAPHLLSDQHAEAVARRALVLRLAAGAPLADGTPLWTDEGRAWNAHVRLVLYTSKEPCGSARVTHEQQDDNKRIKVDMQHAIRKPGKGIASQCRSCCDKVTKWAAVSLLGRTGHRMMAHVVRAPRLALLVVGGAFESEPLLREMVALRCPALAVARTTVPFGGDDAAVPSGTVAHPSGLSMNWFAARPPVAVEVCQPNGKLMGANKGAAVNPKHVSRLSAQSMRTAGDACEAELQYERLRAQWERELGIVWPHKSENNKA